MVKRDKSARVELVERFYDAYRDEADDLPFALFSAGPKFREGAGGQRYKAMLDEDEWTRLEREGEERPRRVPRVRRFVVPEDEDEDDYDAFDLEFLGEPGEQTWWYFRGVFYVTERDLSSEDVMALVLEAENRDRVRLEKAHALMAMTQQLDHRARRQSIPQEVKVAVWRRDGGRCVECAAQTDLEFDHVIPLSMGGSNTERNLQLLCASCNRRKGGTLG